MLREVGEDVFSFLFSLSLLFSFFFFFTFPLGTSEFLTFVIDKLKGKGRFISLGYNFSNKSYKQGKYIPLKFLSRMLLFMLLGFPLHKPNLLQ